MKRLVFFLLFLSAFSPFAFAQEKAKTKLWSEVIVAARGGIHMNRTPYYELGGYLAFTHDETSDGPSGWFGPFFSFERSVLKSPENDDRVISGYRAGLEYNMAFPWGFRCSVVSYQARGRQTLKLCPEAGLSIYCFHLYIGYNIPLSESGLVRTNGLQASLLVGIPVLIKEIRVRDRSGK